MKAGYLSGLGEVQGQHWSLWHGSNGKWELTEFSKKIEQKL